MCVIIDANIAHEVLGTNFSPAGEKVRDWVIKGKGRLVIGGKLRKELYKNYDVKRWITDAIQSGIVRSIPDSKVDSRMKELKDNNLCKSDDHHIIALAQASGARLLCSNDRDLHKDFKNKQLVDNPRGTVYSTWQTKNYSDDHQKTLEKRNLCRSPK